MYQDATKQLLPGDSAAVVLMIIPKLSHMLGLNQHCPFGDPDMGIQFLQMYLTMVLGCLFVIKFDTESGTVVKVVNNV